MGKNNRLSQIANFLFRWGSVAIIIASLLGLFDYNESPFDFFEFISTGVGYGFIVGVFSVPLTILFSSLAIKKIDRGNLEERREMKKIIWLSIIILLILIMFGSGGINLTPGF